MSDRVLYTLYNVFFCSLEEINKSLKSNESDSNTARILLIERLKQNDMLDSDSMCVISNSMFWKLMSIPTDILILTDIYNSNMYKLDLILLKLNTEESKNLIAKYGSDYAKNLI